MHLGGRVSLDFSTYVQFGSVKYSVSFFGFCIRTSQQCKSILVHENTKIESIFFDGNAFTLGMSG